MPETIIRQCAIPNCNNAFGMFLMGGGLADYDVRKRFPSGF